MSDHEPALPEPGHVFEHYLIEARVARGGMSVVFRAYDLRLDRPVALKVIAREHCVDGKIRRFWREAQLSSRLVHPNTVRVYDYGVSEDAQPFIAFELLEGESLAQRLRRVGSLSVEETRRIAVCVLKALIEAHAHGIVHRDIKPANVFLCRYAGEDDFVKLLDFGIAKAPNRDLTAHGWLIGTPGYMPPEQILGGPLGPRTDLYSLGLVIATALSGAQVATGSARDMLAEHASREPLTLPHAVVKSPLHRIVRRAIEKDPANRYASAEEMLAELEGVVVVAPTLAGFADDFAPAEPRESAAPPSGAAAPLSARASLAPVARERENVGSSLGRQRMPLFALLFVGISLLFALVASTAFVLAPRPTEHALAAGLESHDPAWSTALVRDRIERASLTLVQERRVSSSIVDLSFSHPTMFGVVRIETLDSPADARVALRRIGDDGRAVSVGRGRRVLSVWASPRGLAAFERRTSERAYELIIGAGSAVP